ncbi:hypothetical protein KQ51_01361 [Candidatus Izimaplasma bacterium HR1]|jgi:hypothetical protein|uniref:hypothetical protein n=1 Tax=Candidatus Izimoplasma sp. HR1 TaxID=1541959 RepID=UPI0004F6663C|nr:hypothetical protein KQ51_01361 [Candidatus Izimaplasma bacterium HR1]
MKKIWILSILLLLTSCGNSIKEVTFFEFLEDSGWNCSFVECEYSSNANNSETIGGTRLDTIDSIDFIYHLEENYFSATYSKEVTGTDESLGNTLGIEETILITFYPDSGNVTAKAELDYYTAGFQTIYNTANISVNILEDTYECDRADGVDDWCGSFIDTVVTHVDFMLELSNTYHEEY